MLRASARAFRLFVHLPWRRASRDEGCCRRGGRRVAHGRCGAQRCPAPQGVGEVAGSGPGRLARAGAYWRWAGRPPDLGSTCCGGTAHRAPRQSLGRALCASIWRALRTLGVDSSASPLRAFGLLVRSTEAAFCAARGLLYNRALRLAPGWRCVPGRWSALRTGLYSRALGPAPGWSRAWAASLIRQARLAKSPRDTSWASRLASAWRP